MNIKFFTMLEMVVVIVIIAALAAIATPMYFNHVKESRISTAKAQIAMCLNRLFSAFGLIPKRCRNLWRTWLKTIGI